MPVLVIGERALTSLALVLHELATNAVKYGALSVAQGVVHVTWQIEADNLMLRWEERKGPGIEKTPTSEGFGSILVRRSIVGQLGGKLDYIWSLRGSLLLFQYRWNVSQAERLPYAILRLLANTGHGSDVSPGRDALLNQVSVLIVEDEPFIALDLATVRSAGCSGRPDPI